MTTPARDPPPAPGPLGRVILQIPMPRGPLGATSICTIAIGLIASASANIVVGMNVGDLGVHRMFWTLSGALLGGLAIYVFKCHSMLAPGTEK